MSTFRKLKSIKTSFGCLPGIVTYKDFDICIEIGYHQEIGEPLSLKQLLLLNLASEATTRRSVSRLVKAGLIEKYVAQNDHRRVCLILSQPAIKSLSEQLDQVCQNLNSNMGSTLTKEMPA